MKPTEFKIISNNEIDKFEDEVNDLLKKDFAFLGDMRIEEGVFIQPMVKVEQIQPVTMPLPVKKDEKKK